MMNISKPKANWKKVQRACRAAIEPFTMAFKQQFFDDRCGVALCPINHQRIEFVGSHVDHTPPLTFDTLFADFFRQCGIEIDAVELKNERADNTYQDEFASEELKADWIDFHNSKAVLRIVSKEANLSDVKLAFTDSKNVV